MEKDFYLQYAALEDTHWWFVARRQILERLIGQLGLPVGAKILEAGCGTGGNLPMLARHGEVVAMEPDETACRLANQRRVTTVKQGSLPNEIPFADEYDLIVAFDVIEHLDDDLGAILSLSQRLKPGGWLMLTVPAYQFLWSVHDEINHHRRRYRLRTLQTLVRTANLTSRYGSYFNTILFPLVAGVRLLQALGKVTGSSQTPRVEAHGDLTLPSPGVNTILTHLFASERHLLGRVRFPFGVSMVLVAQNCEWSDLLTLAGLKNRGFLSSP